jgi:hypothetical protein
MSSKADDDMPKEERDEHDRAEAAREREEQLGMDTTDVHIWSA